MQVIDYKAREKKILELRFRQKWTLDKIGVYIGTSRERVRQILERLGLDGRISETSGAVVRTAKNVVELYDTKDRVDLEKSNSYILENSDIGYGMLSRLRSKWRTRHDTLHKQTKTGMAVEEEVSTIMKAHGIENSLTEYSRPYDIILRDGRTVEVKSRQKGTLLDSGRIDYHFTVWRQTKKPKKRPDFYVIVLPEFTHVFVIPSWALGNRAAIDFILPESNGKRGRKSPYWKYRDRFDLMKPKGK